MRRSSMMVASAFCSLAVACGDDPEGAVAATDGAAPIAMTDAGPPPPPPPPAPDPIDCARDSVASFSGLVQALSDRRALPGSRVCVLDHPEIPCAITDEVGFYHLECAPLGDAAISFEAEGYASGVWLWKGTAGEPFDLSILLATDAENSGYLSPTGVAYPAAGRSLVTIDPVGDVEGLTVRLRSGGGDGPFFSADHGARIDPALASLPSENELVFFTAHPWQGWSELELEVVPPAGRTCAQLHGAWGARDGAANSVRVLVREGWETVIWIACH